MDIATIQLLTHYNSVTNGLMNDHISALGEEHWNHEFGGYFRSIHSLCNHIYIGDFNWLKRFSALRAFRYIDDTLFAKTLKFSERAFETVEEYLALRGELDGKIEAFIDELKSHDMAQQLRFTDSHGTVHERNFGGLVLHLFTHQTHHRGMVSLYLEELGVPNDYSNLMMLV